jgi:serine/threonine protein kinase
MNRQQRGNTLYAAKGQSIETTLEDFEMIKVVGQGSFGKVYLVKYKKN